LELSHSALAAAAAAAAAEEGVLVPEGGISLFCPEPEPEPEYGFLR